MQQLWVEQMHGFFFGLDFKMMVASSYMVAHTHLCAHCSLALDPQGHRAVEVSFLTPRR